MRRLFLIGPFVATLAVLLSTASMLAQAGAPAPQAPGQGRGGQGQGQADPWPNSKKLLAEAHLDMHALKSVFGVKR